MSRKKTGSMVVLLLLIEFFCSLGALEKAIGQTGVTLQAPGRLTLKGQPLTSEQLRYLFQYEKVGKRALILLIATSTDNPTVQSYRIFTGGEEEILAEKKILNIRQFQEEGGSLMFQTDKGFLVIVNESDARFEGVLLERLNPQEYSAEFVAGGVRVKKKAD
jgi:hypothetical protein